MKTYFASFDQNNCTVKSSRGWRNWSK